MGRVLRGEEIGGHKKPNDSMADQISVLGSQALVFSLPGMSHRWSIQFCCGRRARRHGSAYQ